MENCQEMQPIVVTSFLPSPNHATPWEFATPSSAQGKSVASDPQYCKASVSARHHRRCITQISRSCCVLYKLLSENTKRPTSVRKRRDEILTTISCNCTSRHFIATGCRLQDFAREKQLHLMREVA